MIRRMLTVVRKNDIIDSSAQLSSAQLSSHCKYVKIYIQVEGRCGNQLFYYGFARWLQEKYAENRIETEIVFNFQDVIKNNGSYKYELSGWENSLKEFLTAPYLEYKSEHMVLREGNLLQSLLNLFVSYCKATKEKETMHFLHHNMMMLARRGLIYAFADAQLGTDLFKRHEKSVFVRLVPECSNYINEIRDTLLEELRPLKPVEEQDIFLKKIKDTNSVCVTIRRGDFFTNPKVISKYARCDKDYFEKGIQWIRENIEKPVFFFFSDDIEWSKQAFINLPEEHYFESGENSLAQKLQLMSSCKHFIISNSTFSWWAQWLATYPKKKVVSPERWFDNGRQSFLIEENFVKIPV